MYSYSMHEGMIELENNISLPYILFLVASLGVRTLLLAIPQQRRDNKISGDHYLAKQHTMSQACMVQSCHYHTQPATR